MFCRLDVPRSSAPCLRTQLPLARSWQLSMLAGNGVRREAVVDLVQPRTLASACPCLVSTVGEWRSRKQVRVTYQLRVRASRPLAVRSRPNQAQVQGGVIKGSSAAWNCSGPSGCWSSQAAKICLALLTSDSCLCGDMQGLPSIG